MAVWRDIPGDPGLERTALVSPRGPYVGTPPPARSLRRMATSKRLDRLLLELHRGFGPQMWWPAETAFEVIVGAVLTQNTAWANVERALAKVKALTALTPASLLRADEEELRRALVPSGYYNAKLAKLQAISRWYLEQGGLRALRERPLGPLRESLLGVWGVGPETADSILCYAAARRTAVVDAYGRRILARHGLVPLERSYEATRAWLEERLVDSQLVYEEFHALFVRAGYEGCKPDPRCGVCPATTPRALRGAPDRPARRLPGAG
ncbi:MAG TPA: endonuclease [Planctomycetota bacterium]|nr:endonuclease [Planctomycetota bacterium]